MLKLYLVIPILSVLLLATSFVPTSSGLTNYNYLTEWGSFGIADAGHFSYPQLLTIDDYGSIYVGDLGNKRIQKFSSTGDYLLEWGKSGTLPGEFHYPSGIAVSNDTVFVADRELNRIQKFSTDGEFIAAWGEKGIRDGQFFFPNGIAINNGTLYVVDTGNQRIQMFTTNGTFISSFGSSGLGEGQFLTAVGIDIDDDGNVFISDKGNGKIEKFTASGEFIESLVFDSPNYTFAPESIAIDPMGDMFVVNSANQRILHLPQVSNLYLDFFDRVGSYPNSFSVITDIVMGTNGELLIIDSAQHTIQSFETPFYEKPILSDVVKVPDDAVLDVVSSDNTKPTLSVPISLVLEAEDQLTFVSIGEAIANDQSGIRAIINNAPDAFAPGVATVVWIAFDNAGYSSSLSQTITIKTCGQNHSSYNLIEGTKNDDVIQGTDGDDLIFGLSGDDVIFGGLGNDCIFGGHGNDVISGGDGDDTIKGNSGNDILKGQSGFDVIYSHVGSDVVDGGEHSDRCYSPDSYNDLLLNCEE